MADAGLVERDAQLHGREQAVVAAFTADQQLMLLGAVGGEVGQQQVFLGIHARGDAGERLAQGAGIGFGQRTRRWRRGVVGQQQHAAGGVEALLEQVAQVAHLVAEHRLAAVAGEAEHEQVGVAGTLRRQAGELRREQGIGFARRGRRLFQRLGGRVTGAEAQARRQRDGAQQPGQRAPARAQPASGSISAKLSTRRWPPVASPRRGCG